MQILIPRDMMVESVLLLSGPNFVLFPLNTIFKEEDRK